MTPSLTADERAAIVDALRHVANHAWVPPADRGRLRRLATRLEQGDSAEP
jgi:hypothetical protein